MEKKIVQNIVVNHWRVIFTIISSIFSHILYPVDRAVVIHRSRHNRSTLYRVGGDL
jgi:hypothetical protein